MAPIEWKPEYSVGDPAVDHEHRQLIDLVNRTAGAILDRRPDSDIERGFGDLLRAISAHFALEEREMREAHYDRLGEHKTDHERLLDELRDLMDSAAEAPEESAACIRSWGWGGTGDHRVHCGSWWRPQRPLGKIRR